jgi:serine/threonine-protein kinase RsbT
VPEPVIIKVTTYADLVRARQAARELANGLGFSLTELTRIATAISEIGRNIITFAGEGKVILSLELDTPRRALVVRAIDKGPGIENLQEAMKDGYGTGGGLGLGLPGARRLMDEFEITSEVGRGTHVTMRKFVPPNG